MELLGLLAALGVIVSGAGIVVLAFAWVFTEWRDDSATPVYTGRATTTWARLLNDIETVEPTYCPWALTDDDGQTYACRLERDHEGDHERDERTTETQEVIIQLDRSNRY